MSHPEKSTAIIFAICVVAVGGAALYVYGQPRMDQTIELKQIVASNESPSQIATGTTEDWRAQFLSATTSQYAEKPKAKASAGPSTVTESLGMYFLSKFADLKQANLVGNADIVNQTVDNMLSTNLDPLKPKIYSASDLTVTAATDAVALGTFSNALARLIGSYSATTSEFAIIQEFVSNSDPSVLNGLRLIIAEQKRILTGLLSIPVPQLLIKDHIDLINGFSTLEAASESLHVASADSVRGLVGASLHVDGAQKITDALSAINQLLTSNGVLFNFHWEILNPLLN
jgi:hypothetical protein